MQLIEDDRLLILAKISEEGVIRGESQARAIVNGIMLAETVFVGQQNRNSIRSDRFGGGGGKSFEQIAQGCNRIQDARGLSHHGFEIEATGIDEQFVREIF